MRRAVGELLFKAHRLLYHSPLGLRVIKKKKELCREECGAGGRHHYEACVEG